MKIGAGGNRSVRVEPVGMLQEITSGLKLDEMLGLGLSIEVSFLVRDLIRRFLMTCPGLLPSSLEFLPYRRQPGPELVALVTEPFDHTADDKGGLCSPTMGNQ